MVVVALRRGAKLLFVQRPPTGLWAGLWELPTEPVADGDTFDRARAHLRSRLGPGTRIARQAVGQVTRLLTHRRVTFHLYEASVPTTTRCTPLAGRPARWVAPADLSDLGSSRASGAILQLLEW